MILWFVNLQLAACSPSPSHIATRKLMSLTFARFKANIWTLTPPPLTPLHFPALLVARAGCRQLSAGWGKCWDHCAKDCEIELGQAAHYRRCHHHNVVMSLTLDPQYTGGAGAVGHLISWNQRVEAYLYCYDRVTGLVLVLVTWLGLESGWTCSQERAWACTSCPLLRPLITPGPGYSPCQISTLSSYLLCLNI